MEESKLVATVFTHRHRRMRVVRSADRVRVCMHQSLFNLRTIFAASICSTESESSRCGSGTLRCDCPKRMFIGAVRYPHTSLARHGDRLTAPHRTHAMIDRPFRWHRVCLSSSELVPWALTHLHGIRAARRRMIAINRALISGAACLRPVRRATITGTKIIL